MGPINEDTKNYKTGLRWLVPMYKAGSCTDPQSDLRAIGGIFLATILNYRIVAFFVWDVPNGRQ